MKKKKSGLALALGGGGAKGFAHIGVIQVLEENRIPIASITGTSMGALVGGMYALYQDSGLVYDFIKTTLHTKLFSLLTDVANSGGFSSGKTITRLIHDFADGKTCHQTKIPFCAMATDLATGNPVTLRNGSIAQAIRASISYPPVFDPVKKGKTILVDGGLSAEVPVVQARKMGASMVVAVNLEAHYCGLIQKKLSPTLLAKDSIHLLLRSCASIACQSADVVIEPKVGCVGVWKDFGKMDEIIALGRAAAKKALPKIKKLLRK